MKRVHIFEFEDLPWFPGWLRECMTHYLCAFHRVLGTTPLLADLVARALKHAPMPRVLDLCSGGGGPMPEVVAHLRQTHGMTDLRLTMSDLYPNRPAARRINGLGDPRLSYCVEPIDAAAVPEAQHGVRTMVCCLHHMRPDTAEAILRSAQDSGQPLCAYEISDNSLPIWLWWVVMPPAFIGTFFVTLLIRPMTWRQLFFTYVIPLIPLFVAWDGAVSNARTYTIGDLKELTASLGTDRYRWEMGSLKGRGGNKVWLLGLPSADSLASSES